MAFKGGLSQFKFENLYNQFLGLQPREQTMTLVGAGIAVVLLIVAPIWWASGNLSALQRTLDQGQSSMNDIVREIDAYNKKNAELVALENKLRSGFDENANATLTTLAKQADVQVEVTDKSKSVPKDIYNERYIGVTLKKVGLKQLVDYLYQIEYGPNHIMHIDGLRIKPTYGNRQQLDATFEVKSFKLQDVKEEPPAETGKDKGKK